MIIRLYFIQISPRRSRERYIIRNSRIFLSRILLPGFFVGKESSEGYRQDSDRRILASGR